jgi:hypothetical protein
MLNLITVLAMFAEPGAAGLLINRPLDQVFRVPTGEWFVTDHVTVDPKNPKLLAGQAKPRPFDDTAIFVNGKGKTNNLFTRAKYGSIELSCEFLIPKGSNAGIKFHGHYEIQIFDSFGRTKVDGTDCGGVYPRAELRPRYHHIDKGIPPKRNACKAPGSWQTLTATFIAPKFDAAGKRVAKARLERVELNGEVIHDHQELDWPTGNNWHNKEMTTGPIMFQADHGPVAFRNIRVRSLDSAPTKP